MKHPKTLAREALLHATYGKFDWIVNIIPPNILLTAKPRRVKEWLVQNLQVSDSAINANTLRSWLYRYRKSLKKSNDAFKQKQWEAFEPSVIKPRLNNEKLIIKKVSTH